MIVIKYPNGSMLLNNEDADISEFTISGFRKILKLASNTWCNKPADLWEDFGEWIDSEISRRTAILQNRKDTFFTATTKKHHETKIKKLEKMKTILKEGRKLWGT